jgi:hypothetical protein
MAKSKRVARKARKHIGNESLILKRGQRITFPVAKNHRLARFQTLKRISSPTDIAHFMTLWGKVAKTRDASPPSASEVVSMARKAKLKVLHLQPRNLTISKGAALILRNPLNRVSCTDAVIDGDLVSQGELVLQCQTLRA